VLAQSREERQLELVRSLTAGSAASASCSRSARGALDQADEDMLRLAFQSSLSRASAMSDTLVRTPNQADASSRGGTVMASQCTTSLTLQSGATPAPPAAPPETLVQVVSRSPALSESAAPQVAQARTNEDEIAREMERCVV